jgi:hypothetical protein
MTKIPMMKEVNKVAKSELFYYLMLAATALQLYKIFMDKSTYCLGMFALAAIVSCQFTKNKSLCLLAGLIVTNFVVGCSKIM